MIPSIRAFLIFNLLLSITLITSLLIIANLFLGHREIQNYMDEQLIFKAVNLQDIVTSYLKNKHMLNQIQNQVNTDSQRAANILRKKYPSYEEPEFQIWDLNNRALLHSLKSPPLNAESLPLGFSDRWINGEKWRLFFNQGSAEQLKLVVAEKYNLRDVLETRITRNSVLIILISYPFISLIIWLIVGKGLESLKRIALEVRNRELSYLEPVNVESVPSEIKPLIDELNELFQRLTDAYARERRFAADAAHELKTPLAALKAQAQVALKARDEKIRSEALKKVVAGVNRSTHVVQQLLILSRMVPEANQGEPVRINLASIAAEVIAELVPEALEKNTEIELDAVEPLSPMMGFPTAIGILVRNLVDNAIRYTPNGSLVKVVVTQNEDNIILQVIDNGPGIPEELRERVFERFFRVLGNKSTGSGLGLGIVQQIATLHSATILLETPPSCQGLCVTVKFPK